MSQVEKAVQTEDNQSEEAVLDQANKEVELDENQAKEAAIKGIGELIGDSKDEAIKEKEDKSQEEIQEESETQAEPIVRIIDDALIEQFPTLRMYRGKPIDEVLKSYDSLARQYTKVTQEYKEFKKKTESNSLPVEEAPDPVDKPDEFKAWLQEYTDKIREEARGEIQQTPDLKQVLKEQLPDADVQKVVDEWKQLNSYKLFDFKGELRTDVQEFYNKNPEVLIQDIVTFYNLSSKAQKNDTTIKNEVKKEAYNTVKNAIKQADKHKNNAPKAQINPVPRTENLTKEEELLGRIATIIPIEE